MGQLPVLKPREVVAILLSFGFAEIRQRGSHKQFRHTDPCKDISPILLRQIAKEIGLTAETFIEHRK